MMVKIKQSYAKHLVEDFGTCKFVVDFFVLFLKSSLKVLRTQGQGLP